MGQYSHGFELFELGVISGQTIEAVERGRTTIKQAAEFLTYQLTRVNLAHKEKVVLTERLWRGLQRAEELKKHRGTGDESANEPDSQTSEAAT